MHMKTQKHWNRMGKLRHGHCRNGEKSPIYRTWKAMLNRCLLKTHVSYPNYGGRGITVFQPWVESFDRFLLDVGGKPEGKYTLDRIDSTKGYEPGNVRWATYDQQMENKTNNVRLLVLGDKVIQSRLHKRIGSTFHQVRKAISQARSSGNPTFTLNGFEIQIISPL